MTQTRLKTVIIFVFIYLSAFLLFQMNATAHDVVCPPCNCGGGAPGGHSSGSSAGGSSAGSGGGSTAAGATTSPSAQSGTLSSSPSPAPVPGWMQAKNNQGQQAASAGGAATSVAAPTGAAMPNVPSAASNKDFVTTTTVISSTHKQNKKFNKIYATFVTSVGNFKILLFHTLAPKTVENFVGLAEGTKEFRDRKTNELVKRPFYNGLKVFRVRKDFFIQTGDPNNDGTGGPGYTINDEFQPQLTHSKAGIVSMANGAPNQNGSQFFISLVARPDLDNKSPVFGEVIQGLEVVQAMSRSPINRAIERPLQDIVIQSVEISRE